MIDIITEQPFCQTRVMRSALYWWNKLSKSQQRTYEMQMFGYGEWWEDNSLCDADILKMYHHYA